MGPERIIRDLTVQISVIYILNSLKTCYNILKFVHMPHVANTLDFISISRIDSHDKDGEQHQERVL